MVVLKNSLKEAYKDFTEILQGILSSMRGKYNSREVAKLLRYAQRCNTDGELGRKTAPNVKNVCAEIKKYGDEQFEVGCKRVVTLRDRVTGYVFVYEIDEDLQDES